MTPPSPSSRRKFAECCSSWFVLRQISAVFDDEGFEPAPAGSVEQSGERRTLVARYHAAVNWRDPSHIARLLKVYAAAIREWRDEMSGWQGAPDHVVRQLDRLIEGLQHDGIPIDDRGVLTRDPATRMSLDLSVLSDPEVIREHLRRIDSSIERDPALAIGSAKELLESTCRLILADFGSAPEKTASVTDLYKAAAKELALNREAVEGDSAASQAARKALQGMASTVGALAEMRNALGTGHGKDRRSPALARHARMAAHAAQGICGFLLETWDKRRRSETPTAPVPLR